MSKEKKRREKKKAGLYDTLPLEDGARDLLEEDEHDDLITTEFKIPFMDERISIDHSKGNLTEIVTNGTYNVLNGIGAPDSVVLIGSGIAFAASWLKELEGQQDDEDDN